ncbi:MAG: hypothetical protein ACI84O_000728 [Myxococcota bacterium]|jgi:uncharacterized protein involved in exopolysaccharide biosynthesis
MILIYERIYVIAVVTAVAMIAAFIATDMMGETYRSQARCYLPAQSDTLSLSEEAGNLPTAPKLPTANTETQTALLGVLHSAELRTTVASQIEGRNSAWLKDNVKFALDTFNFIVITAYDAEPRIARQIAETYLREFKRMLDTTTKQRVAENVQTLVAAIDQSNTAVTGLESQRQQFLETNSAIDFVTEITQYHGRVNRFQEALESNASALASLEKQQMEVIKNFEERPEFSQSGYTEVQNPRINQLNSQIAATELEIENAKLTFTDKTPEAIALNNKLSLLLEQLAAETLVIEGTRSFSNDDLRANYESRISEFKVSKVGLDVQKEHYTALLTESKTRLRQLNLLKSNSEVLDSELRNVRETLRQQRDRHAELALYMSRTASFLMTAEAPVEATKPYFPILWINLLVAGVLGVAASMLLIIVGEQIGRYREDAPW